MLYLTVLCWLALLQLLVEGRASDNEVVELVLDSTDRRLAPIIVMYDYWVKRVVKDEKILDALTTKCINSLEAFHDSLIILGSDRVLSDNEQKVLTMEWAEDVRLFTDMTLLALLDQADMQWPISEACYAEMITLAQKHAVYVSTALTKLTNRSARRHMKIGQLISHKIFSRISMRHAFHYIIEGLDTFFKVHGASFAAYADDGPFMSGFFRPLFNTHMQMALNDVPEAMGHILASMESLQVNRQTSTADRSALSRMVAMLHDFMQHWEAQIESMAKVQLILRVLPVHHQLPQLWPDLNKPLACTCDVASMPKTLTLSGMSDLLNFLRPSFLSTFLPVVHDISSTDVLLRLIGVAVVYLLGRPLMRHLMTWLFKARSSPQLEALQCFAQATGSCVQLLDHLEQLLLDLNILVPAFEARLLDCRRSLTLYMGIPNQQHLTSLKLFVADFYKAVYGLRIVFKFDLKKDLYFLNFTKLARLRGSMDQLVVLLSLLPVAPSTDLLLPNFPKKDMLALRFPQDPSFKLHQHVDTVAAIVYNVFNSLHPSIPALDNVLLDVRLISINNPAPSSDRSRRQHGLVRPSSKATHALSDDIDDPAVDDQAADSLPLELEVSFLKSQNELFHSFFHALEL